ncbi:MAG: DUF6261 family protein [Reichenbachiella sp.]
MPIREIVKSLFTSSEVDSLGSRITAIIDAFKSENAAITALNNLVKAALEELKKSRLNSSHNTQTDEVAAGDQIRDLAFRAFYQLIAACAIRQNEPIQLAAKVILTHLERIDRALPYLGYEEETRELEVFFGEMDKVTAHLETISATAWLEEVRSAELLFQEKRKGKSNEDIEKKVLIPTKQTRDATVAQLITLCHLLNGLEMANIANIAELNTEIDQIIMEVEIPARSRATKKGNKGDKDD